jgi:hypothetical protein
MRVFSSLILLLFVIRQEELTELLRSHCDADAGNLDMDITASGNGRGSVETASAESSLPPSPPQMNGCYGKEDDAKSLISSADGRLYIDEDADEDSESNIPGVKQIGSSDSRGNSCGGKFLKGNQEDVEFLKTKSIFKIR